MGKYDALMAYQMPSAVNPVPVTAPGPTAGKYDALMAYNLGSTAPGAPIIPQQQPYDLSTDSTQGPLVRGLATAIKTAFPVNAIEEMSGQAMKTRPFDPAAMAGSLGQLAIAAPLLASGPLGEGARAAAGASGAMAGGLEAADVKNPIAKFALPLAAGLAAGHLNNPQTAWQAVPKGEEINALGRVANGMGIDVPPIPAQSLTRTGPNPADIRATWEQAMQPLGENVGTTKQAAMQTTATTPDVLSKIRQAMGQGLQDVGVPKIGNTLVPDLSTEPQAAALVMDKMNKLGLIPSDVPPAQAMTLANNILEGAQKTVAGSSVYGPNMAGRVAGRGLGSMQEAINSLGNPEAVAAHQDANRLYSKGSSIQDLVSAASKGKGAGPVPMFRPKDFISNWQNMPTALKESGFSHDEIQAIDSLTQQNPNTLMRGIQYLGDKARDLGLKPLAFHPSTRFYENGPTNVPSLQNLIQNLSGAYRASTYKPSQDPDLRK